MVQDDLLYATLTVYETLLFAAMLRLPKHKSKAEKVGVGWLRVALCSRLVACLAAHLSQQAACKSMSCQPR